jgi:hypothetical protein
MPNQSEASMTRLIRAEVRAQMKRYARARKWDDFVNELNDVLSPALKDHYVARLCELHRIGFSHADEPEESWQHRFGDRLVNSTNGRKLDHRKAIEQSLKEVLETDVLRRRLAILEFQQVHAVKAKTALPPDAHEDFVAQVREYMDLILE